MSAQQRTGSDAADAAAPGAPSEQAVPDAQGTPDGQGAGVGGQPAPRSRRLTAAAALAGAEGLALAAAGLLLTATGLFGRQHSLQQSVMGGLTVLALAALPLSAAYGLLRARRWSRGPALIVQLIALPVAWTMGQNGGALLAGAVALGAVACAELVLLVHPAATEELGIARTATDRQH